MIVTLGSVALEALKRIQYHELNLKESAARIHSWNDRVLVPIYHPSPQVLASHRREAEQRRGSARQRGYGKGHETRFRPGVLARDPVCVLCGQAPSVHADHWPLGRRELTARGLDPDDPDWSRIGNRIE